jgi:hypothetical protein
MSEFNLIYQYCCITGKYCSYNKEFQEGYLLGILTFIIALSFILYMFDLTEADAEINKEKKDN